MNTSEPSKIKLPGMFEPGSVLPVEINYEGRKQPTQRISDELRGDVYRPQILNRGVPVINGAKASGKPWFSIKNEAADDTAEVLIYDFIGKDWWSDEGVGAKDFAEALAKIPKSKNLLVKINSPGGNVRDGIAIYTELKNRGDKVTTYITGAAISIASVIALAGKKVMMARTAQFMIHDPWSALYVEGTKEQILSEAQKIANALDNAKESILTAYADKTGKSKDDLTALMSAETWMTGDTALEGKFVDQITDDAPTANSFDLSSFKRVPEAFRKLQNSAAQGGGQNTVSMRNKIIARLKKMGIQFDEKATDEQLVALLDDAIEAQNKQTQTQPAAQAQPAAAAVPAASAPSDDVVNRLKSIEAKYESERKQRITNAVNKCIEERRIVAGQAAFWIEQAMANESVLTNLQAMPQQLPAEPVSIAPGSDSISDITTHLSNLRKDIHHLSISDVDAGTAKAASVAKTRAAYLRKHENKIAELWNTNTIPSQLQQDVIVDIGLRAFKRVLFPLTRFCSLFSNVPLRGTDTVQVPFIDLETAASTSFVAGTGYQPGNTVITYRPVTVNNRFYQGLAFTSQEIARQPFLWVDRQMTMKGEKLAYDVWVAVIGLLTTANGYSITTGWPKAPGAFDSNALNKLRVAANTAQWSPSGRFIVTNAAYDGSLAEDNAVKLALNIGGTELIRGGKIPNLYGFDYFTNALLPDNGINLASFIAVQSAAILAQAPIPPVEEVVRAGTMYSQAVDPDTGITLEYRSFGSNALDRGERYIEANYGFNKGNANAAQLQTSA